MRQAGASTVAPNSPPPKEIRRRSGTRPTPGGQQLRSIRREPLYAPFVDHGVRENYCTAYTARA